MLVAYLALKTHFNKQSTENMLKLLALNSDDVVENYGKIMERKVSDEVKNYSSMSVRNLLVTWESTVQPLNFTERMVFLTITIIVCVLALMGNLMTIYVIFARKQRLLFRTCLFSLAFSNLLFVAVSGTLYISRLLFDSSMLWSIGAITCSNFPFIQTVTVLTDSMSIVSIALDRYLAVSNKRKGQYEPGKIFCCSGFLAIWFVACGISSPTLFSYGIVPVIVVPDEDHAAFYEASFCITSKEMSSYYYNIVFCFIFTPIFIAFLWLNTVIAREIWRRRHAPGSKTKLQKRVDKDSSTLEMKATVETNTSGNNSSKVSTGESRNVDTSAASSAAKPAFTIQPPLSSPPPNAINNEPARKDERKRRQMRMFKVILVLMLVFIVCRLPNWIFLLYKLNNLVSGKVNWMLYYTFGIMGLVNCMLNPLLYTFLVETIRISSHIGSACYQYCKFFRQRPTATTTHHYANNQFMYDQHVLNKPKSDNGGVYLGDAG